MVLPVNILCLLLSVVLLVYFWRIFLPLALVVAFIVYVYLTAK